ncbi:MAG: hypothetical protein ACI9RU_003195 [Litorivivens sp.]|jgi:hypothetical protein
MTILPVAIRVRKDTRLIVGDKRLDFSILGQIYWRLSKIQLMDILGWAVATILLLALGISIRKVIRVHTMRTLMNLTGSCFNNQRLHVESLPLRSYESILARNLVSPSGKDADYH